MKTMRWKIKKNPYEYGKWYFLHFTLSKIDPYYGIWIREPICIEALQCKRFPLMGNKHEIECPQTEDCGWIMKWTEAKLFESLKSKSLSDAKLEVKNIVISRLEDLLKIIKEAK